MMEWVRGEPEVAKVFRVGVYMTAASSQRQQLDITGFGMLSVVSPVDPRYPVSERFRQATIPKSKSEGCVGELVHDIFRN